MNYEVKKLPKSEAEIAVTVPFEEVKKFLAGAAEKISREAKIEGFRPGKAPYEIIKQKFGEMAILQEASEDIVIKTYHEAVTEAKLVTIGQPKIEVEKMAPENDFAYKATVAVLPEVTVGDYGNVKLEAVKVKVDEKEVEHILEDIKKMRSQEALVDRAAKTGDRLEINFEVFLDKVPIEGGQHQKYPITIGENRFIPGFEEQLAGMKAEEVKEFELKFPEEYFQKNLAGKLAEFRVKCSAVYEVTLPEINDEFASAISGGKFKTAKELQDNIRENLTAEKTAKAEQELENKMLEQLVGISRFGELPEMLLHNESHRMVHELEDEIVRQGGKFDDYLKSINKTHDDLEKDFQPQAEMRVKTSILCREIYQKEKIEVTDQEVTDEVNKLLLGYPNNPQVQEQINSEYYRDYLKNTIGNKKVIDFLKSKIVK